MLSFHLSIVRGLANIIYRFIYQRICHLRMRAVTVFDE